MWLAPARIAANSVSTLGPVGNDDGLAGRDLDPVTSNARFVASVDRLDTVRGEEAFLLGKYPADSRAPSLD
jgi:hypothetical protein